jgi:hypothetical protein
VHLLELAERGGNPGGWILEVDARQPDLLSRAGKGAQEGNKPGVRRVRGRASGDGVVGDAKSALVVRLVQAHVHPSALLLVPCLVGIPGALLQEPIGDLVVNVLGARFGSRAAHGRSGTAAGSLGRRGGFDNG